MGSLDPITIAIYVALAALVGVLGYGRRIGVLGTFILALVFTPLLMLLVLIITRSKPQHPHEHSS